VGVARGLPFSELGQEQQLFRRKKDEAVFGDLVKNGLGSQHLQYTSMLVVTVLRSN